MRRSLGATLTVRLPAPAMRRVRARASERGVTPSALVREALAHAIAGFGGAAASAYELSERWVGAVGTHRVTPGRDARRELERWNPDRRQTARDRRRRAQKR